MLNFKDWLFASYQIGSDELGEAYGSFYSEWEKYKDDYTP